MRIGKHIIRTHYLLDRSYQIRHVLYVALIIFLCCCVLSYLVFIGSWAYAVNKTLQSVNLYPGEQLTIVTKDFVFKSCLMILFLSLFLAGLWSLLFSHRVAGPAWRFKRTLSEIARGRYTRAVKLRKGDYLKDLADSFNTTLKVLEDKSSSQLELVHQMKKEMAELREIAEHSPSSEKEIQDLARKLTSELEQLSLLSQIESPA